MRLRRAFRELPQSDTDANRTGVAVVSVFFGLVLAEIARGAAQAIRALEDPEQMTAGGDRLSTLVPDPGAALWHYGVAFVLVVTSFVGYFGSKHGPQLRIKFFNIPFFRIGLDCAMVGSYFVLAQYAEGFRSEVSATPEALLVTLSFVLYGVWDLLGWMIRRDARSRLALALAPEPSYGGRRNVTLIFLVLTGGVLAASVWTTVSVIALDALLIGLLFAYRVAKSFPDTNLKVRSKATDANVRWREDHEAILPDVVTANIRVLRALSPTELRVSPAPREVLLGLERAGLVTLVHDIPKGGTHPALCTVLTETGATYVDAITTTP